MIKLKIHFVGIKGVGMTPLAIIAKEAGFKVTGSDTGDEFITDIALKNAGIDTLIGFSEEHIQSPDLVIITGAHGGYDNIEAKTAKSKNIKVITQGEAVGHFMTGQLFGKKFVGISVAGTHGKTTTSAMLATIFKENLLDPSFVIGTGEISSLGAPGHLGRGKYFIAEADEYATEPKYSKKAKLLWQYPNIGILTNIEFDHPDIYDSIEDLSKVYLEFINQLPKNGVLIACGDDREIRNILSSYNGNTITYGFNSNNDYILENVHISGDHVFFKVSSRGTKLSDFMLRVVGNHNCLNAVSVIIASLEVGLPIEKIKKGLMAFTGSKRRLELMGDLLTGARVYDDYAHHPTEIKTTLQALRSEFPKKKIIGIFQPHTYSRTKKLFDEFITSFSAIDTIILTDIFSSVREAPDLTISTKVLFEAAKHHHKDVIYLPSLDDVIKYLNEKKYRTDTVLITMGAGDIYKIHSKLKYI